MRSVAWTLRPTISIKSIVHSARTLQDYLRGNLDSESHCFQILATLCCTLSKNNMSKDRVPKQTPNPASENPFFQKVRSASDLLRKCQRWDHETEAELHKLGFPLTYEFIRLVLINLHEDVNMALKFFIWTEQWHGQMHSPRLCLTMVEILVKANNFEDLLWEMLENSNLFNTAVMLLVECYVFMRCPVKAFEELKQIKNSGFNRPSQNAYNVLFTSLVREGFLSEAKEIYTEMLVDGMKPSVFALDSLLIALCDHRKAEDAAIMLEDMEIQGFFPSSTCCAVLISELCRGMQGDRAYRIVSGILKRKSRKTRSLNICVYAFCKAGQLEKAEMLIEESLNWGYVLDTVTYNSLIAGFCWTGRVEESRLILDRIMEAGCVPDVISYNTVIVGYSKKGMLSHSLNVFDEMMRNGISPDVCSYNSVIHGFSKVGKLEEANKFLQDMMAKNLVPCATTYNIILNGLCKSGKASDALKLFRKLKGLHFSPKIETYNILIDGLCKAGKLDDSHRILKEAGELGYVPTLITYTTVMTCCFRSGKLEQGLQVFSEMKSKGYGCDAFTYCTVISGLSKLGKFQEACACIGHMLIRGIVFDLVIYNSILNTFCKAGQLERAFHLLYDMESRGWIGDVYTNTILIAGLCKAGDMDTAYRHFTAMIRKGCVPNLVTYNALVAGFCKVGKVDIAIDLFKMMEEKDRITYTSLLHGLCKAGRVLNAYNLLLSCLKSHISVCDSAIGAVHAALCNSLNYREVRQLESIIQMTKILQE